MDRNNDNNFNGSEKFFFPLKTKILNFFIFLGKQYVLTVIVIMLLAAIIYITLSEDGFMKTNNLKTEKERLTLEIEILKDENRLLKQRIERFKEDNDYLEDEARNKLGLVRDNEVIYRLAEEPDTNFEDNLKHNIKLQDK